MITASPTLGPQTPGGSKAGPRETLAAAKARFFFSLVSHDVILIFPFLPLSGFCHSFLLPLSLDVMGMDLLITTNINAHIFIGA